MIKSLYGVEWYDDGYIEDAYTDRDEAIVAIIGGLFIDYFGYAEESDMKVSIMEQSAKFLAQEVQQLINEDCVDDKVYLHSMTLHC